jgi:hypothetical protein
MNYQTCLDKYGDNFLAAVHDRVRNRLLARTPLHYSTSALIDGIIEIYIEIEAVMNNDTTSVDP